jgi:2-phosphosulfolactate phosphatase
MHIPLYFAATHVDELTLRDQTVVVIDVLRAATTIAVALSNGAKEIIPVNTVERAVKISGSLFGDHILRGGERNGRLIEGFNLGNSPDEYTTEKVRGKAIIYSTTNGSGAIDKAKYGRNVLICSFVNMASVLRFLRTHKGDVTILCSGNNGRFSMEDSVCAGMLISRLVESEQDLDLSDAAQASLALFRSFGRSIPKMIRSSEHGQFLIQIGHEKDLDLCASVDCMDILPVLSGNVIRARKEADLIPSGNPVVRIE